MKVNEAIQKVAVLGAGGKMGRGIALVLLKHMAKAALDSEADFELVLMDTQQEALDTLKGYFKPQLEKDVERKGLPTSYVDKALVMMKTSTELSAAKDSRLIFEAIVEDLNVKTAVFKELKEVCTANPYFLSKTSSIPISVLDEAADLDHRIIGFHFYNPPPVQKLVELIPSSDTDPILVTLSEELGRNLGKILVRSHDVAGFIGNGHFMREILYACQRVSELVEKGKSWAEAVYLVNTVTQEYLIRPMGIFQLLDYVGLDVAQKICGVMAQHIPQSKFEAPLIEKMLAQDVKGGQHPDGSQKAGFLQYEKGKPVAVYDLQVRDYVTIPEDAEEELGDLPACHEPWKNLLKDQERDQKLNVYFGVLFNSPSPGAALAQDFLRESRKIAESLVNDGVADKVEDVNTVLESGFYHLYGPANRYY